MYDYRLFVNHLGQHLVRGIQLCGSKNTRHSALGARMRQLGPLATVDAWGPFNISSLQGFASSQIVISEYAMNGKLSRGRITE